jgi:excisionase family DNA binding protein
MTAYATVERLDTVGLLAASGSTERPAALAERSREVEAHLLDALLARLADLVAERLAARSQEAAQQDAEEWMDTRRAAEYLGVHRDTIRKLAAERAIPTHQDGPGCKLYFRRDELDEWRRSSRPTSRTHRTQLRAA